MNALILTAICFAVLWTFWRFLNWVFDLIEEAHAHQRDQEWR